MFRKSLFCFNQLVSVRKVKQQNDSHGSGQFGSCFRFCIAAVFFVALSTFASENIFSTNCVASSGGWGRAAVQESSDANGKRLQPPKMRDYDRQLKSFVKNSRREETDVRNAAIFNLCELHRFVVADGRYPANQKMVSIRNSIVRRLSEWEKDIRKAQRTAQRTAQRKAQSNANKEESPLSGSSSFESQRQPKRHPLLEPEPSQLEAAMFLSAQQSNSTLGELTGGPNQLFAYSGGHFGPPWDHSEELIALLQTIVTPQSWSSNGGNATMMYFQPSRALVVRASQRTQDKICEMLYLLRAAF